MDKLKLFLNLLLHFILLWIVLFRISNFFIWSELDVSVRKEIKNQITKVLKNQNSMQLTKFVDKKKLLHSVEDFPDYEFTLRNELLKERYWGVFTGAVLLFVLIVIFTHKRSIPMLSEIFIENFISLILIGIIEGMFFKFVAKKYMPIASDELETEFKKQLGELNSP